MSHYEKNERVKKTGLFEKFIQRTNHKGMKIRWCFKKYAETKQVEF